MSFLSYQCGHDEFCKQSYLVLELKTLQKFQELSVHFRGHNESLGHSRIIDRASSDLTKTAITVTVIFVVSIGYDLHYYLLGYTGVTTYALNTPIQKVGLRLF